MEKAEVKEVKPINLTEDEVDTILTVFKALENVSGLYPKEYKLIDVFTELKKEFD